MRFKQSKLVIKLYIADLDKFCYQDLPERLLSECKTSAHFLGFHGKCLELDSLLTQPLSYPLSLEIRSVTKFLLRFPRREGDKALKEKKSEGIASPLLNRRYHGFHKDRIKVNLNRVVSILKLIVIIMGLPLHFF